MRGTGTDVAFRTWEDEMNSKLGILEASLYYINSENICFMFNSSR
jgi:hypothetical protein